MLFKLLVVLLTQDWIFSVLPIGCNQYLKYREEFSGLCYISLALPETLEKLAVEKNLTIKWHDPISTIWFTSCFLKGLCDLKYLTLLLISSVIRVLVSTADIL